jgi:hypothetical protein
MYQVSCHRGLTRCREHMISRLPCQNGTETKAHRPIRIMSCRTMSGKQLAERLTRRVVGGARSSAGGRHQTAMMLRRRLSRKGADVSRRCYEGCDIARDGWNPGLLAFRGMAHTQWEGNEGGGVRRKLDLFSSTSENFSPPPFGFTSPVLLYVANSGVVMRGRSTCVARASAIAHMAVGCWIGLMALT